MPRTLSPERSANASCESEAALRNWRKSTPKDVGLSLTAVFYWPMTLSLGGVVPGPDAYVERSR
jgi:hypothetical protein